MRTVLTFDVEVWCDGWTGMDSRFASSFERRIFGRSETGSHGLPHLLDTLARHRLHGVFFVEPLFAARFGIGPLERIVTLIQEAGQEVQLHLHPEWSDEGWPDRFPPDRGKRPMLSSYAEIDQRFLIRQGLRLLGESGASRPTAFRAGNFGAGLSTYYALASLGIPHDSSFNRSLPQSVSPLPRDTGIGGTFCISGVRVHPMGAFRDGLGKVRHAQVGACSFGELRAALEIAEQRGAEEFVLLAHSFELLKRGTSSPDATVVKRFSRLCAFLDHERVRFPTCGFLDPDPGLVGGPLPALPVVTMATTAVRMFEQARGILVAAMARSSAPDRRSQRGDRTTSPGIVRGQLSIPSDCRRTIEKGVPTDAAPP